MHKIVEIIKTLCANRKTTLADLERQLGFSKGSISKWNTSSPSIDKVQKVAAYFHVSIDYLLGHAHSHSDIDPLVLIKEKVRSGELAKEDMVKIIQVLTEELGK